MRFRGVEVAGVAAMSLGIAAGADITTSPSSVTSVTSATSSKCTPGPMVIDGKTMIAACETETETTTTTSQGLSTSLDVLSTTSTSLPGAASAETAFTRSTTTIPTAGQSTFSTSLKSSTSLFMSPPGKEEPHSDLLSTSTSLSVPIPTAVEQTLVTSSTSMAALSYSCPPCDPNATPKTVSIECLGGVLPAAPPKAQGPCNCPASMTKTACYGPHPMTPASSLVTSTRSASPSWPFTFNNGTVYGNHPTGTGSAVSAGLSTGIVPTWSTSHSTSTSSVTTTLRSTQYVTQASSTSKSTSHSKKPHTPLTTKSSDAPVFIPTISTKSKTLVTCTPRIVTVTDVRTTVSTLIKFETVVDGTYAISRQTAHTVDSAPTASHRSKELEAKKNTSSKFATVSQPTAFTVDLEPKGIPTVPAIVINGPTFNNGVEGLDGSSPTTSTPEAPKASLARGLGGDNDARPASLSTQYTRGRGGDDDGFPFTVSRNPQVIPATTAKTGVEQDPTHLSHASPAASSGRLPRPFGPHNGTVPMGTGRPHIPKHPHSRPTHFPETESKTMA